MTCRRCVEALELAASVVHEVRALDDLPPFVPPASYLELGEMLTRLAGILRKGARDTAAETGP